MKHPIDPKVDCVFKALLGAEENRNLLVHFLNAVLAAELNTPLVEVTLINPYSEKEFLNDKLSIVDVKAKDGHDNLYQVEIQLSSYRSLPARMLYNWADLYSRQLRSGEGYGQLRPTYSIWLLAEDLFRNDRDYARYYQWRDNQGRALLMHGGLWLVELNKFAVERIETELERWLKFFIEGERLDDERLPAWMDTEEMRHAMNTLRQFSEKERDYHRYQARLEYLRQQRSIQCELETLSAGFEQAQVALEQAESEKQAALQQKEAAVQREEAAVQREEAAVQQKEAALQQKEAAVQQKEAALQREEAALQEIERLKALLDAKAGPS